MTRLIRGGRVVTATDAFDADVLIDGETIVAVGSGLQGDEEIDASGCLVLPGLVDNHTHLSMPFGGTWSCDDYDTGTAAAAAGGTTSIVDFCIQYVGGSLKDALEEWHGRADGAAHIDYGFHCAITDARPEVVAEMGQCVADGVTSFKVFMAYKGALMVDDEQFIAVLEQTGITATDDVDLSAWGTGAWSSWDHDGAIVLAHDLKGSTVVLQGPDLETVRGLAESLLPADQAGEQEG